jgi:hypothetical protein
MHSSLLANAYNSSHDADADMIWNDGPVVNTSDVKGGHSYFCYGV